MNVTRTIEQTRRQVASLRGAGSVGLVPTMGALHAGHLSLIDAARGECGAVVVSIFVNPTQFAPGEDLHDYPRTPDEDLAACESHGVDVVFAPTVAEMYPSEPLTEVNVKDLDRRLCGASREGHFTGVCTVVTKLFNIIRPDAAYFGAKDYQQSVIVRRMVEDLNFPVKIIVCPTVHEDDGLAVSSRNTYLTADQRKEASALYRSLREAREMIERRHPPAADVVETIRQRLASDAPSGEIDYVSIVDPHTLREVENTSGPVVAALAVKFGKARLIDNMTIDSHPTSE